MLIMRCTTKVTHELSDHELECREQHLQLAMDTVVRLVHQVKALQDEVEKMKNMWTEQLANNFLL